MNTISLFLINILLAVLWILLWGVFDIYSLLAGFAIGYLLLGLVSRQIEGQGYGTKAWNLLTFLVYFIRILIKANLQVAWEIITPGYNMTPRFIRYSVEGMTPLQITSLANAITLTPGTLSVDVSDDNCSLYIHNMYAQDREAAIRDLDELHDRIMKGLFG